MEWDGVTLVVPDEEIWKGTILVVANSRVGKGTTSVVPNEPWIRAALAAEDFGWSSALALHSRADKGGFSRRGTWG